MRASITVTVCVLILLGAAIATHRYVDRTISQPVRDFSKMISVKTTVADALSAYFKQHGRYPESLAQLPAESMEWGNEGSSAADLNSWQYRSDGRSFTMTWEGERRNRLFVGGENGHVYFSETNQPPPVPVK